MPRALHELFVALILFPRVTALTVHDSQPVGPVRGGLPGRSILLCCEPEQRHLGGLLQAAVQRPVSVPRHNGHDRDRHRRLGLQQGGESHDGARRERWRIRRRAAFGGRPSQRDRHGLIIIVLVDKPGPSHRTWGRARRCFVSGPCRCCGFLVFTQTQVAKRGATSRVPHARCPLHKAAGRAWHASPIFEPCRVARLSIGWRSPGELHTISEALGMGERRWERAGHYSVTD